LVGIRATSATAARAVELLPAMLGADGPREWLVIAQNNAEQRSTGGIPGTAILLRADHGNIRILSQATGQAISAALDTYPTLDTTEEAIFGQNLARYFQDVNFTPDFPRTGDLAVRMWTDTHGGQPTGVVSLDPVALASFLDAAEPVAVTDPNGDEIRLTGENAAEFLLQGIYQQYPNQREQDEVFSAAAQAIVQQFTSNEHQVDAKALLAAAISAADAHRINVWSAIPAEQDLLADTVLSGALRGRAPQLDGSYAPVVGVYQNLAISGKTGFYLQSTAEVESAQLRADGSQKLVVRVRLENTLPPGAAEELPAHVTGNGPADGSIPMNLLIYAPENGEILSVRDESDQGLAVRPNRHEGLAMVAANVSVRPHQARELWVDIVTGRGQTAAAELRLTPGAA
jgi:hypothetical protein